ncbi:hypothetical protein LPE509_00600 [Legionella pneumophila subsp. pneumophila LPE509]|nr:hypothetical protein LPE509_00600 [Legionella pneumophila subsp. pneumophila LPE509]
MSLNYKINPFSYLKLIAINNYKDYPESLHVKTRKYHFS